LKQNKPKAAAKHLGSQEIKCLVEAAIFISDKPISLSQLKNKLFNQQKVSTSLLLSLIDELSRDYQDRGIELVKLSQGYRFQSKSSLSEALGPLYNERTSKMSPALMETLAIIAYQQPITRSEIEEIRGVAVSSHIVKTLTERQWIKVDGQKDVPGRPALLVTTAEFLNYFALESLQQLPEIMPLAESSTDDSTYQLETEA